MSKFVKLGFALFLTLAMSGLVMAQSEATTGRITGTIKDSQGAAVPNATVTISNASTGFSQTVNTNENGEFNAVQLKPGDYTVEVTATGFGKSTQTGYHVEVGSALTANIALGVGNVSEEVLVTAAGVDTSQVQTTTNINDTSISQLPINGRRFQDFVLATPGAQIDPARGQISLSGQRGINGNVQIDGGDYNNPFFGGLRGGERSNQAFTIPQSAVREFQVVASGFNAEFGRSTGGVVNVVTKSGTNDFSGGAFYVVRPQKYAHKNAFSQIAAPTQKQFGGSLGGPLPIPNLTHRDDPLFLLQRDKAFFFVAYEEQRLTQTRAVLFNNLHLTGIGTPGTAQALGFALGLEGPYGQTNNAQVVLTRFDFNLSQKHQLSFRYNYSKNTALNSVTAGTSLTPTTNSALSNNGTEGDDSNTFVSQLNSFLNPTLVNEFRFQYSKENRPRLANELSPLLQNGFGTFGTVSFLPTTESDYRLQFADNLTVLHGAHTMKFGVDYNKTKASQLFAQGQTGIFSFSGLSGADATSANTILQILSVGSAGAGDPANRYDDTRVRYARQIGNGLLTLQSTETAFFGQDSWRMRPNFTLSFGLRYELQIMPKPDTSNTTVTSIVQNANLPVGRVNPAILEDQKNQWAPRAGFAWDPWKDGKGVIRGYSGIYYARTPLISLAGPLNNFRTPPGDLRVSLPFTGLPASLNTVYKQFNSIGINLNNFPLGGLPILSVAQLNQIIANIAAAGGTAPNPLTGLQLATVGAGLKNPRSFQWGFAVEREVARGLTIGGNFDYVNTVHLNFNRDYDLPFTIIRPGDRSLRPFFGIATAGIIGAQNRPLTQFGNGGYLQVRESGARSLYRGMTFRAQLRRKFGQFDAFYTLAKNLDSDSSERNASFSSYDNVFNLNPEYSYGALDRRHMFAFSTVINAPFGFEIAANSRFLSSAPLEVSVSGIVAPAGSGLTNGQYAAQVTLQGSTSGDLNQDAGNFDDRPYTAPGVTQKRNSYRNRPVKNVDLRIQRNFRFKEKYQISPSLEIFNLFDFQNIQFASTRVLNYGNPGINEKTGDVLAPSNVDFLKLRDTAGNLIQNNLPGAPLQIQFGLRFSF
jgi:outer membrane receptor protein involved in Fe transport